jgi:hypothetical protein
MPRSTMLPARLARFSRMTCSNSLRRLALAAALSLSGAMYASAQSAPPTATDVQDNLQPQKRDAIGCEGAFARDTTHARLVTAFGAQNVTFKEVDAAEGPKEKATVLFDDDPTRRVLVFWHDERTRARPSMINISAPSLWIGPGGIGNGMKLSEVVKLNGKPFKLAGFDWHGGGFVRDLDGKLKQSSCNLVIRFEPGIANPLPAKYAEITGDKTIASTNRLLRRTRAQVSEWGIGYPK